MERKIGEIFEYNGEWYQCVGGTCRNCSFYYDTVCKNITTIGHTNFGNCHCSLRTDHKSVIFKKLEKRGKPYPNSDKLYQLYILPMNIEKLPTHTEGINLVRFDIVEIEIKQNKEDMEEKKLNLKPFDLQKAREGNPVCTMAGRKARIICFDRNDLYPIVALIECEDGKEIIGAYSKEGQTEIHEIKGTNLMMLSEKKEGWVNVYYDNDASSHRSCRFIYDTKERAVKEAGSAYIATVKIEWTE